MIVECGEKVTSIFWTTMGAEQKESALEHRGEVRREIGIPWSQALRGICIFQGRLL